MTLLDSLINENRYLDSMEDFRQYYHLEPYLIDVVGPRFRKQGTVSQLDFFCIVVWKANRSKSKILKLLRQRGAREISM